MAASTSCCRSCPRCSDCPVVAVAALRGRFRRQGDTAALISEVLHGRLPRPLPDAVERTLAELELARRGTQPAAA